MDDLKCRSLKADYAHVPEPQIIPIARFFDGNDDLGSIGCNLAEHPGIDTFRNTFAKLISRADVQAIYAQIAELDPGEDSWPFSDLILVVGTIPVKELQAAVSQLCPDDVGDSSQFDNASIVGPHQGKPVLAIWWD